MTWERFGYICRKASVELRDDESVAECLSRIENESGCNMYGKRIPNDCWPRKLLIQIGKIEDRSEAKKVIETYGALRISKNLELPMQFKRVTAYLALVTIIFYLVATIYQLFVFPVFSETLEMIKVPATSRLINYEDYWNYSVLAVSFLIVLSLVIGFRLRRLFRFEEEIENDPVVRYLVAKSIKNSYAKIVETLCFPALNTDTRENRTETPISTHLFDIKNSRMNLATEIQILVEQEARLLMESCEKQVKLLLITVALILVAAIISFLIGAYSPMFYLGETV